MSFERNVKRDCLFYTQFNDIGNTKIDLCTFKGDKMFDLEPAICAECETYIPLDEVKCKYRKKLKLSGGER